MFGLNILSLFYWCYYIIGFTLLALGCGKLYLLINELLFFKEKDFQKRYGVNSWAVVTGASDGIGLGFVKYLSSKGFNVLLISRTESKLQDTIRNLNVTYPNLKYKYICADFTNSTETSFFDKIFKEVENMSLDISICVNNVGALAGGFHNSDYESLRNTLITNITSVSQFSNYFTRRF